MLVSYVFIKCDVDKVEMKNELILLQTKVSGEEIPRDGPSSQLILQISQF